MSEKITKDSIDSYFEEYGDRMVGLGVEDDGYNIITDSGTLEEMYQMFKARMLAESSNEVLH